MDATIFVGILSAIISVLTLLGVGLYRIISSVLTRMQKVEHEIVGNGVSDGLVGRMEDMQQERKRQHKELSNKLDSQEKRQQDIVRAIERSDHIDIDLEQNNDKSRKTD